MGHPTINTQAKAGTSNGDNALLLTSEAVGDCNEHVIFCTAGTIDVEGTINGGANWTDSATFPLAMLLLNATDPGVLVTELTAGQMAVLLNRLDQVRLRQKGGTASAAHVSSYAR